MPSEAPILMEFVLSSFTAAKVATPDAAVTGLVVAEIPDPTEVEHVSE